MSHPMRSFGVWRKRRLRAARSVITGYKWKQRSKTIPPPASPISTGTQAGLYKWDALPSVSGPSPTLYFRCKRILGSAPVMTLLSCLPEGFAHPLRPALLRPL